MCGHSDTLGDGGDGASSGMLILHRSRACHSSCPCSRNPQGPLKHVRSLPRPRSPHGMWGGGGGCVESGVGGTLNALRRSVHSVAEQVGSYLGYHVRAAPSPGVLCGACSLTSLASSHMSPSQRDSGASPRSPVESRTPLTPGLSIPLPCLLTVRCLIDDTWSLSHLPWRGAPRRQGPFAAFVH